MKIKIEDLTGPALDWAVTSIEDPDALRYGVDDWIEQRRYGRGEYPHRYHQNWAQGGPIIERERIDVRYTGQTWGAARQLNEYEEPDEWFGPTPLMAAMRCYVASRLREEVDIPDELIV